MMQLVLIGALVQMGELGLISLTSSKAITHPIFIISYIVFAVSQILILFFICMLLTKFLFSVNIDPDNNVIPILTALGDLIGTVFLAVCLLLYQSFHTPAIL